MDRGAWWATVRGIPKSWTQLSDFHFHFHADLRLYIAVQHGPILKKKKKKIPLKNIYIYISLPP